MNTDKIFNNRGYQIGNIVQCDVSCCLGKIVVMKQDTDGITIVAQGENGNEFPQVSPVPINREILELWGFKKIESTMSLSEIDTYEKYQIVDGEEFRFEITHFDDQPENYTLRIEASAYLVSGRSSLDVTIIYLHQLQNIAYALFEIDITKGINDLETE